MNEKEEKERKKKAPREERRGTALVPPRAEESTLHGKAWAGHHYTKINSFSASSPESLDLLPW